MTSIQNANIAILEARMSEEMGDLLRRYGGRPYSVPAVREVALDRSEEVAHFIDQLTNGEISTIVFFTGVGAKTLFAEAERLGRQPELLTALQRATIVSRGPKPAAVLRRYQLPIAANAQEPYTTDELVDALAPLELGRQTVAVVHYGERNAQIAEALRKRGAAPFELCLYEWLLPPDSSGLQKLVVELIAGQVDAIIFTSQIHVRHLFLIAEQLGQSSELKEALQKQTIVASVGPTCSAVLHQYGIEPHVEPEHPKMGHLIKALAEYMH